MFYKMLIIEEKDDSVSFKAIRINGFDDEINGYLIYLGKVKMEGSLEDLKIYRNKLVEIREICEYIVETELTLSSDLIYRCGVRNSQPIYRDYLGNTYV